MVLICEMKGKKFEKKFHEIKDLAYFSSNTYVN